MPQARSTDGQSGDVLTTDPGVKRLNSDIIQVSRFVARRSGSAEIVFVSSGGRTRLAVTVK